VLGPAILARQFDVEKDLANIDALMRELDGTTDKRRLGANAILGISMACARAAAAGQVCCPTSFSTRAWLVTLPHRTCLCMNFFDNNLELTSHTFYQSRSSTF
jgi:hypothetical protein